MYVRVKYEYVYKSTSTRSRNWLPAAEYMNINDLIMHFIRTDYSGFYILEAGRIGFACVFRYLTKTLSSSFGRINTRWEKRSGV